MNRPVKKAQLLRAAPFVLLMLLCACERTPDADIPAKDDSLLPPTILSPSEAANPAERPSYEVGIATAAADRNRAKEKCVELPEVEREACNAAADAAFTTAEAGLDDLRGNQQ